MHGYRFVRSRPGWLAALAVAVLIPMATAGPATAAPLADPTGGSIRNGGGPDAVPDSYIVVFKDAAVARSQVATKARSLAGAHQGEVGYTYTSAVRGFSVRTTEAQARMLAADPAVAYVEQDHKVHTADTQQSPPSWGLDRIDQRSLPLDNSYFYPTTGAGVTAYVIDTGIRITHTDFGGRARYGYDFIDNDPVADDCYGHGTHVAGTIGGSAYGVAKTVQLVAVRVLNCSGSGTWAQVTAGVDWVTGNAVRPAVANMSLGGTGSSATLEAAVRNSIAAGVTYALAAGNSAADACGHTPARVAEAITVGATGRTDARPAFSNFGTCLDIFAPGVDITSAWNTSDTATNTISGTSMATPHVAGAAALYLQMHPDAPPQQVRDKLVGNATIGAVGNPGTGSPNLLLFTGPQAPDRGVFSLAALHSGKCLDITDAATGDTATARQWNCGGGFNQAWLLNPTGTGSYTLTAAHSGKCLDVNDASTEDGAAVWQFTCHGGGNQQWRLDPVSNSGAYTLTAVHSGKCLDVNGVSTEDGATVYQFTCHRGNNQLWRLTPPVYQLTAVHSGKCLDVNGASTANGALAQQWTCHGGGNQRWRLGASTNPSGFTLTAVHSGRCLDVNDASLNDRATVWQYACHRGGNQQWQISPAATQFSYLLTAAHSGKCLDVNEAYTDDGATVFQFACHGGGNQQWTPAKVS